MDQNDFILKMLRGGAPSALDFVAPFMDQKIGTPGINPNAEDPRMTRGQVAQPKPQGKIGNALGQADKFLSGAGGGMLMNLLAQSGYSTMPGSPFGAIGRAGLATQQQQAAKSKAALEEEFMRARIGLANKQAEQQNGGQRVVQSAQTLSNGNIGYLNAFTGEVVDTGSKAGGKGQIIDMPGVGQVKYDPVQGTLTQVNPEDVIRAGEAGRAGAKEGAVQQAQIDAIVDRKKAQELAEGLTSVPEKVAGTEAFISEGRQHIERLKSGELNTGPIRGRLPTWTTEEQLFEAYSGAQILEQISSVTLGALSKGEMDFLKTTVSGRTLTPEANIDIIERKIAVIEAANKRALEKIGQGEAEPQNQGTQRRRRYNPTTNTFEDI